MKNLILCIIISSFWIGQSFAQEKNINFGLSGNIGLTDVLYENDGTVPNSVKDQISENEKPWFGYNVGAIAEYKLTNQISIQSGIGYSKMIYQNSLKNLRSNDPNPLRPSRIDHFYHFSYIEIPLIINFHFKVKSQKCFLRTGFNSAFSLGNSTNRKLFYEDYTETISQEDTSKNIRSINVLGEVGLGWQFSIGNRIEVALIPNFKIQTLANSKKAPLNRRLFFFGLGIELKV